MQNLPDNLKVNTEILMNNPVPQSDYFEPFYLRMAFL
jgi:hypothetical protein